MTEQYFDEGNNAELLCALDEADLYFLDHLSKMMTGADNPVAMIHMGFTICCDVRDWYEPRQHDIIGQELAIRTQDDKLRFTMGLVAETYAGYIEGITGYATEIRVEPNPYWMVDGRSYTHIITVTDMKLADCE